jgi:trans-aconitate 2-methyltransferase
MNKTTINWNATDYHRHSSQQQVWARELIAKLNLRGDEHVLDVGCGDGKVTAEIGSRVPGGKVVGVDVSADMIGFAQEAFLNPKHPNLSFRQADASALSFDAEFDVVFSNAVLHWIRDHRPVLAGIARALRPRGRVLLQMGGQGNAADVLAILDAVTSDPAWAPHFKTFSFRYGFYAPAEYQEWLRDAGLTPQRVELIPKDMVHPSADAFAGWFRTTWMPWIQAVPEQRRDDFIELVVQKYLASHPPDADGRVHVRMVRLEVQACKSGSAL